MFRSVVSRLRLSHFFSHGLPINLRGLLLLSPMMLIGSGVSATNPKSPYISEQPPSNKPLQPVLEMLILEPSKPVERQLSGGQSHPYNFALSESQYVKIVVDQNGIDIKIVLTGTDGKVLAEIDNDGRKQGEEVLELVAEGSRHFQINVVATHKVAAPGMYKIQIAELRVATNEDRDLEQARKLEREGLESLDSEKFEKARNLYQQVLAIREKVFGYEHPDVAAALIFLGWALRSYDDMTKAKQIYERALTIYEKTVGKEHQSYALTLECLGMIAWVEGDDTKSLQLTEQALAIYEKVLGLEHGKVGLVAAGLAVTYMERGDYIKAEILYKQAIDILQRSVGEEDITFISTLNNLAYFYTESGNYEQSDLIFQRVLKLYENLSGPESSDYALVLSNLVRLNLRQGEYAKAGSLSQRALPIAEMPSNIDSISMIEILSPLADYYRITGDYAKAELLATRSLKIAEKYAVTNPKSVAEKLHNLSIIYAARDNIRQAINYESQVIEIRARSFALNLFLGSEREKASYLALAKAEYDQGISLHTGFAQQNTEALRLAVEMILQRKARLLDVMSDGLAALRRRTSLQDQALLDQWLKARSKLAQSVLNGSAGLDSTEHQKLIQKFEDNVEHMETEIGRRISEFRTQMQTVSLKHVQAAIPSDSALIEIVLYHPFNFKAIKNVNEYSLSRYAVYVIRSVGIEGWIDLGEAKEIDEAIEKLREALRDKNRIDVRQLARAVDEKVMQPLRPLLGDANHLLLSPDGALNLIPFAALVDEKNHYLIERYGISYLTSGRDLLRLQVARDSRNEPLVVADPIFGEPEDEALAKAELSKRQTAPRAQTRAGVISGKEMSEIYFNRLRETASEAQAIKTLFPKATALTAAQATESALKQAAAPRILHIATHGFFLSDQQGSAVTGRQGLNAKVKIENPLLRSGLALAGANLRKNNSEDDGILTAMEVAGLNLWGTKLVVLSACETGLGEVKNGEGVYGLRRALVLAGSETQVMSLWKVDDKVTREWMTAYYTGLKKGLGRGEALRQVQLQMLKDSKRQHPFYWASFIQSGEWGTLDGKR